MNRENKILMPKASSVKVIFDKWLDKNEDRFNHPLILKESCDDYATYTFKGISPNIGIYVSFESLTVDLVFFASNGFLDNFHDSLVTYILPYIDDVAYDNLKGFYSYDASNNPIDDKMESRYPYEYFQSISELYISTLFEPFLGYINEMLTSENSLYLLDSGSSATGFIASSDSSLDFILNGTIHVGTARAHHFIKNDVVSNIDKGGYELYKSCLFNINDYIQVSGRY